MMNETEEQLGNMLDRARDFALKAHNGQRYGEHPYAFHLQETAKVAQRFGLSPAVHGACWLHDTMEDCQVSYGEMNEEFGETIAELVYCVTDELGRTRKERKHKTYPKIQANEEALQVKLCDRIANFSHALASGSEKHIAMYRKEYPEFKDALYSAAHNESTHQLWRQLDELFSDECGNH